MTNDAYQKLNPKQRSELLSEVSIRSGLSPAILEKDYWVCRTLDALFSLEGFRQHMVFKGGTSLSKVFGLIDRFSEDIDISFHRGFLGFNNENKDPELADGTKERNRRLSALQDACAKLIRERFKPELEKLLLEKMEKSDDWSLEIDKSDPQTILFHYPKTGIAEAEYIQPVVRIEMGARSDHWPSVQREIRSYIGETLEKPIGVAKVDALAVERTFWEKATLLHAEYHRERHKPMPARYARHYYDLAMIATSPAVKAALNDRELRERVVAHKSIYFRSGWARYDLARPGTFRLVPDKERLVELQRDHNSMKEMFFAESPTLHEIVETLRKLEESINDMGY